VPTATGARGGIGTALTERGLHVAPKAIGAKGGIRALFRFEFLSHR
jgi:hypothetical protein